MFEDGSYYAKLIQKLILDNKIKVTKVKSEKIEKVQSQFRLDEGEAAAYVMYNNKKHKAMLTDDGELIKLCKLQGVPFICAMAIVLILYEKKKLTKEKTIEKLEALYEVGRYSENLYEHFMKKVR